MKGPAHHQLGRTLREHSAADADGVFRSHAGKQRPPDLEPAEAEARSMVLQYAVCMRTHDAQCAAIDAPRLSAAHLLPQPGHYTHGNDPVQNET